MIQRYKVPLKETAEAMNEWIKTNASAVGYDFCCCEWSSIREHLDGEFSILALPVKWTESPDYSEMDDPPQNPGPRIPQAIQDVFFSTFNPVIVDHDPADFID